MGFTQRASCSPWQKKDPAGGGYHTNVFGGQLQSCGKGTGYLRGGYCAGGDDGGKHWVCLRKMTSDFCEVTGQPDWCADYQGDPWCVCQHAYDRYHEERANDERSEINCAATNWDSRSSPGVQHKCHIEVTP